VVYPVWLFAAAAAKKRREAEKLAKAANRDRDAERPAVSDRFGVRKYLRKAFLAPYNLLFFLGGMAAAAMSPAPDAALPLVMAAEMAYLAGLSAIPRFRQAVDAEEHAKERGAVAGGDPGQTTDPRLAQLAVEGMLRKLPAESLRRFEGLRRRCLDMRDIGYRVRAQTALTRDPAAESIRTPALDRLLFLFLKLLVSQEGLRRFLDSTSEPELKQRADDVRMRLATAQGAASPDDRVVRSLQDSLADTEMRVENYRKSSKDAEFVALELDRIETKIQALVEMGVSQQDPDLLSAQVNAAAESMQYTETAVNRLQHLTGLEDQLDTPPPILDASLGRSTVRER